MNMNRLKGLIYGSFIGDALSLGPHWIYDTSKIDKCYRPITGYTDPDQAPYHKGKKAGDFTHYGDQSLLLLKSIAANHGFNLLAFKKEWLKKMDANDMYLDHASKESILKLKDANIGSDSDELGGFSRSGPLFAAPNFDETMLTDEVKLTHNNPLLITISLFFSRVIQDVLHGTSVQDSIERHSNISPFIYDAYEHTLSDDLNIIDSILVSGQSCSSHFGLPAVLSVLTKESDFKKALIQNAYAGGDSASRAMIIGMVLGGRIGYDHLPVEWVNGLSAKSEIDKAWETILAIYTDKSEN